MSDRTADEEALQNEVEELKLVLRDCVTALEKCQQTFFTLEKLKGFSTVVPPNIVVQSVISIALTVEIARRLVGNSPAASKHT